MSLSFPRFEDLMSQQVGVFIIASYKALPGWLRLAATSRTVQNIMRQQIALRRWIVRAEPCACSHAACVFGRSLCASIILRSCVQLPEGERNIAIVNDSVAQRRAGVTTSLGARASHFGQVVVWYERHPQQPCVTARVSLPAHFASSYSIGLILSTNPSLVDAKHFFLSGRPRSSGYYFEVDMDVVGHTCSEARITMRNRYTGCCPWLASDASVINRNLTIVLIDSTFYMFVDGYLALRCEGPCTCGLHDVSSLYFFAVLHLTSDEPSMDPLQAGACVTTTCLPARVPGWLRCHVEAEFEI